MKVFISGSISIKDLPQPAIQKIDNIINKKYVILIGDAGGVDFNVQKYLLEKKYANVVVYFVGGKARNNIGSWETMKVTEGVGNKRGRELYTVKDIAMAKDSNYGLMIWDGKSRGTLNNIREMKKAGKRFLVVLDEKIIDGKDIDGMINIQNKQIKKAKLQPLLFQMAFS